MWSIEVLEDGSAGVDGETRRHEPEARHRAGWRPHIGFLLDSPTRCCYDLTASPINKTPNGPVKRRGYLSRSDEKCHSLKEPP